MRSDPTYLGTVQNVQSATVSVKLDESTVSGLAFIEGYGYRIGQIGSFVRIPLGYLDLFGVVSQVGAGAVPEKLEKVEPHGHRWLTVQIVGEGRRNEDFKRGISQYPTIGDKVHLVTEQDLVRIYGRYDAPDYISIGQLASAESIPALINVNKLVTRHCAVVGATGSGKSTTIASLLTALSDQAKYPSARIIIVDIHGEYPAALKDQATVFRIYPNEERGEKHLYVPYWAMKFEELLPVTLGELDDSSRGSVLEKITDLKLESINHSPRKGVSKDNLTVDTPVPFSINKFWFDLHKIMNATHTQAGGQSDTTQALLTDDNGNIVQMGDPMKVIPPKYKPQSQAANQEKIYLSQSTLHINRQLEGLASKLRDPRYNFLFRPGPWFPDEHGKPQEDIHSLIEQWIGGDNNIVILDLSGIPSTILNNLIGVLLRIVFDVLFWSRDLSEGGRERPLLLVLEEAHAYLGHGNAAKAVKRIVKEGRKYGIGAMVVSQRPSEIDATILSQCGTIVAMRLANSTDRSHVTSVVTDNLEGLLGMLPVLRTGEAIVVGEAVHIPMRALVKPPPENRRPDSKDPLVYDHRRQGGWNRKREVSDYSEVVEVWRKQEPRSPSIEEEKMKRTPVSSSDVASVGYDETSQTLEVGFHNGGVYQYFDVPKAVYEGLIHAESVGKYFHANIKGVYRYARVE